ncbi:MAG: hypothetical protein QNJ73_14405, partial [Gammaproteobacteria bacterium]|nr:hypothetical protein [Gammaproteobacteria bacterium]
VVLVGAGTAVQAAEAFQLQTADADFYGVTELEAGQYDRGSERFELMLNLMGTAPSLRAPVLNNLCVTYIAQGRLEEGADYCNEAVANGRELGLALNNRGVMHARAGLYDAAVADFEAAIAARGTPDVARDNLRLAQRRVAQLDQARDERVADNEQRLDGDGA